MMKNRLPTPTDRDTAEYFQLALRCGIASTRDVERWGHHRLANGGWAAALTHCGDDLSRVLTRLDDVVGSPTGRLSGQMLLARAHQCWKRGEVDGEALARSLYELWPEEVFPEDVQQEVVSVDDDYDLVDEGKRQAPRADSRLGAFLERFEPFELLLP